MTKTSWVIFGTPCTLCLVVL